MDLVNSQCPHIDHTYKASFNERLYIFLIFQWVGVVFCLLNQGFNSLETYILLKED